MKHKAVLKQDFESGTCIDVCMEFNLSFSIMNYLYFVLFGMVFCCYL